MAVALCMAQAFRALPTASLFWLAVQTLMLTGLQWINTQEVRSADGLHSAFAVAVWSMIFLASHMLELGREHVATFFGKATASSIRTHRWVLVFGLCATLILCLLGYPKVSLGLSFLVMAGSHLRLLYLDSIRSGAVSLLTAAWLIALGFLLTSFEHRLRLADVVAQLIYMGMLLIWSWRVFALLWTRADLNHGANRAKALRQDIFEMQVERERKAAQASSSRENVQKMADRQSEFLATMSHELRTPLACVVGLSRMLAASEEYGNALRKDMGTIERLAVQLLRMVDDGLAFVRQEPEEAENVSKKVHMAHLLRDVKSLAAWLAKQQRNEIRFLKVRNIPGYLYFDEQRVRQILINLLSNAARYCQDGEIVLGVALRGRVGEPHVLEWLVEDTGRGMDAQEQLLFFNPFSKSRDSQGLGLGLALVKRLVHEVQGEIKLQSEKGRGTRFRISIPVELQETLDSQEDLDEEAENPSPDDRVSAPMALLPHVDLEVLNLSTLKKLVRLGQLSEIESWLEHAKSLPGLGLDSQRLLRKIENAVKVVDLPEIQALIDQVDTPLSFV